MAKTTLGGRSRSLASRRTLRRGLGPILSLRECPDAPSLPQPLIFIPFLLVVALRLTPRITSVSSTGDRPTSRIYGHSSRSPRSRSILLLPCLRWLWTNGSPASSENIRRSIVDFSSGFPDCYSIPTNIVSSSVYLRMQNDTIVLR